MSISILNISIDLLSSSISEIHGSVDFRLLKEFERLCLKDEFEDFLSFFKENSEWAELMLSYVPDETLEGRVTAPGYYAFKILSEGIY
ncbi:MAG TPA: hypothetical protein VFD03_05910 [Clostridia bacterium]|nr:hypothetical protein [Clostridia bacterium]